MVWEYTATGWLVHLSETESITDPQEQYEAVARQDLEENGIRWLEPAPGNDTYAIAVERANPAGTSASRTSRIWPGWPRSARRRRRSASTTTTTFATRFDGLPGLQRVYGFQFPEQNLIEMSLEAVYGAVQEGEICNFGVVFTTSGFLQEANLRLLEDDKDFFAVYNPSLTIRQETFEQYPQLSEVFAPISGDWTPRRCGG